MFCMLHRFTKREQRHSCILHQACSLYERKCAQGVQQEDHSSHCQVDAQHQIQGKWNGRMIEDLHQSQACHWSNVYYLSFNSLWRPLFFILFHHFLIFKWQQTAYNIGRCQLLTEDWIIDSWKHRNDISFNVNNEDFVSLILPMYRFGIFKKIVKKKVEKGKLTLIIKGKLAYFARIRYLLRVISCKNQTVNFRVL